MRKLRWQRATQGLPASNTLHVLQTERGTTLTLAIRQRIAGIAFLVFFFDDFSKYLAVKYLPDHPVRLLGSFLQLELQFNSGAAFSVAVSKTLWLSWFSIIALAALAYFGVRIKHRAWASACGLVIGGILGNLADRIFRPPGALQGQVVDWIKLTHWPTFNLADSSIVAAAILVFVLTVKNQRPYTHQHDQDSNQEQRP